MISKCAKFHWHSAYSSKVKGRAFLTFLPEIKYPTADNPNNIGLTFSQKKSTFGSRTKSDFSIRLKTHKTYKKIVKKLVLQFC